MWLAIVVVYLFGMGVLVLVGFWVICRKLDALTKRGVFHGRALRRSHRRAGLLLTGLRNLSVRLQEESDNAAVARSKMAEFIDGPPSLRRPVLLGDRGIQPGEVSRGKT